MLFYLTLSIISNGQIRSNARDQSSLLDEQKKFVCKIFVKVRTLCVIDIDFLKDFGVSNIKDVSCHGTPQEL